MIQLTLGQIVLAAIVVLAISFIARKPGNGIVVARWRRRAFAVLFVVAALVAASDLHVANATQSVRDFFGKLERRQPAANKETP